MAVFLGIDPGWKNLGFAVLSGDKKLLRSGTLNPSAYGNARTVELISDEVSLVKGEDVLECVTIERFVSYKGVHSADSENILMLIGALEYYFTTKNITTRLFRAADWKIPLVKLLVKERNFDNPSQSLDKGFSLAAARCCTGGHIFKTDHEADAACLAYFGSRGVRQS